MANSLPFNAVAVDGEYDRVYKAEDWAWYFATFIANGNFSKAERRATGGSLQRHGNKSKCRLCLYKRLRL